MRTARIITHNPESTEALSAYLRDQGYDVVYAASDDVQPGAELTIAIEACPSPLEAVARARELAGNRGCDVFVGEGVVEQIDLAQAESQPEAAESLDGEPGASDASGERSEATECAAATAELLEPIADFVVKEISSLPLVETSERGRVVAREISCSEVPDSEEIDSRTQWAEPARRERPIRFGRVVAATRNLAGLRFSAWLERARSASQLAGIHASAGLERILLRQQLRAAVLAQRLAEQQRLAEEKRQEAIRQAGSQREEARREIAHLHQSGTVQPGSLTRVIFKTIRARLQLCHRWIVDRLSGRAGRETGQDKVTPIGASRQSDGGRGIRDWKMAFTGAGVAALLVLFVLGVFTGRGPATNEIQAAQKTLQLNTTARPAANREVPHAAAIAAPVAGVDPRTSNVAPAKSTQAAGAPANSPSRSAAAAHQRIRRSTTTAADAEQEVIVRHFNRGNHPAAKVVAGVKHYSDLN